jgi:oligopeptide transport system substrate-binding protein
MKTITRSLAAGIVGVALASTPALATHKTHPVTGEVLSDNQTYTYVSIDESSSLDPGLIEDVSGAAVARDLFEGLLTQNADGTLAPGVATRYTTNADKTVYTFHLRRNARWSNGDPVTAHDFEFAWKRAVSPELASPYSWYMEIMSIKNGAAVINGEKDKDELGAKALDDYTFQVTLEASLPYFPSMVVHTTTMPVPTKIVNAFGDEWTKPGNMVSNGAYVLSEHVLNERQSRVRNDLYWNNDATILDKVTTVIIQDENAAFNRYIAGEVDQTAPPSGQFNALKKSMPNDVHTNPRLCTYYYNFNMDAAPFDDKRVRQALSYTIPRDIIIDNILQGGQIPAYTFTPGATANFTVPEVAFGMMTQAERDAAAVKLLAEAGYSKSNPLKATILYNTSEGHKNIAIATSQMWKQKLGVEITLENQEWKTFLATKGAGDFEIARAGWCGDYNEASTFLDLVNSESGYNDSNYNNPVVDKLLAEAKTMSDPNGNYTQIEKIIADDMPIAPIYHYTGNMLLKPYVKGYPFNNVEGNWYSRNMYITAH